MARVLKFRIKVVEGLHYPYSENKGCVKSGFLITRLIHITITRLCDILRFSTAVKITIFITDRSKAVVLLWFPVICFWCQSFGDGSPYVCLFILVLVRVTIFWEIAAHSVEQIFSLYFVYL